jgi:2-polyprenyl-3-methyl-5-hydroxy-6-metoxy-1,4-benzoquinol methylase
MTWAFPPDIAYEFAPCNHCGSADERELFCGPDRLHNLPGQFRVVECTGCGWLRQNPRPTIESIGYYYPSDYINFTQAIEDEPRFWKRWDHRYGMLKERWAIERIKPKGRILDVGCATGNFLREMQRAGWDAVGVEPHPGAADYARQRFGLPVHAGTLREAALPAASFDVITLIDVLEHLHTPWEDLKEVSRILADEGLLVVRIPNLESIDAKWFGPAWLGWDLPRHLTFVSRLCLIQSLNELGLKVTKIGNASGSYTTFMLMLEAYLQHLHPQPRHWSKLLIRIGRTMPARLAFAPLFWMLDQAHRTTNITFFFRKDRSAQA